MDDPALNEKRRKEFWGECDEAVKPYLIRIKQ